jgi:exonuclease VII large subunit
MEATVEERVDRLEALFGQFMTQTSMAIKRLEQMEQQLKETNQRIERSIQETNQRFERNIQEANQRWERSMREMDQRWEQKSKEMTREYRQEMAHISDRVGRFTEDFVIPNVPRLGREVFGIETVSFFATDIKKQHPTDPAKSREFDVLLTGARKLLIVETKSTARLKYLQSFAERLNEVFEYFPEYRDYEMIPIFASLALSPDFVRQLTQYRVYAMALGDETMEIVNLNEVRVPKS